ncbi:MAG: hypothetical protein F6J92_18825 [Symploca sp. SIO1A3]|nr:hypothetical protein [Symploca sp. SIO1A3]
MKQSAAAEVTIYYIPHKISSVLDGQLQGKRQEAGGRRQEAGGRRQKAGGRRQEAEGAKVS